MNVSGERADLPRAGAMTVLVRAIVAIFTTHELRGVSRDPLRELAQDSSLPPPHLCELWTVSGLPAVAPEKRPAADIERSSLLAGRRAIHKQRSASMRSSLPIGPSCC